ncbi:MAG: hypothetical protein EA364_00790 [Balneolaceae bacterium]|nr:MAG: hypothetical protein EA364_00790 [Balneolaceae bacterium]
MHNWLAVFYKIILISVLMPVMYTGEAIARQGSASHVKVDVASGLHIDPDNGEIPASLHLFIQPGFQVYTSPANQYNELFGIRRLLADLRLQHKQRYAVVLNADPFDHIKGPLTDLYTEIGITKTLAIRAGRFAAPFSEENQTPARLLQVPERYTALTSFQNSGSYATKTGIMLTGALSHLNYAISTGFQDRVQGTRRFDVQARLSYRFNPDLRYGIGVSYAEPDGRQIRIADNNGFIMNEVPVHGRQYGILGSSEWHYRSWHTKGELFLIWFDGNGQQENSIDFYYGSYSELGYFFGSDRHIAVHRLTGRLEVSQFYGLSGSMDATKRLYSLSLAHSWRIGSFITLHTSTIYNLPDRIVVSDGSPYNNGTGLFQFLGLLSIGI